ncbi:MAG: hypothetical protein ABI162_17350 [Luteolibacter sp.]
MNQFLGTITLSRRGAPDVHLECDNEVTRKFRLEAGDHVKLEISDKMRASIAEQRKQGVALVVDGYPAVYSFMGNPDGKSEPMLIPTLIGALVHVQLPQDPKWLPLKEMQKLEPADLIRMDGYFQRITLLPHPDLSRIRIRRLKEDGSEKLMAGDVVEISLIKEHLNQPWKGFSDKENAFFSKALAGRVQVIDKDGNLTSREIGYKAPRYIETEAGWIPLPPASGVPSTRAWWLVDYSDNNGNFVKRGDRISSDGFV